MSDQKLDELSQRLSKTLNRIDELQQKPTWSSRIRNHFRTQGSSILNVVLAGCVLSVAIGRLVQQNNFEEERQGWAEERRKIATESYSLQQRVAELELHSSSLRSKILDELQEGGWRLAPVAARIRGHLLGPQLQTAADDFESDRAAEAEASDLPALPQAKSQSKLMT